MQYYYLINRPHLALPIVPIMSLTAKENPRSHTAASCHVSLVCFNVEQYFNLFFFLRVLASYFAESPPLPILSFPESLS